MKILDAGHKYRLFVLDSRWPGRGEDYLAYQELRFVKREGEGYPGNEGNYSGTNIQDVLRCLIDRCKYLYGQIPCEQTNNVILCLRDALWELEERAAERHGREKPKMGSEIEIDEMPFCKKCGHVGCGGECHPC